MHDYRPAVPVRQLDPATRSGDGRNHFHIPSHMESDAEGHQRCPERQLRSSHPWCRGCCVRHIHHEWCQRLLDHHSRIRERHRRQHRCVPVHVSDRGRLRRFGTGKCRGRAGSNQLRCHSKYRQQHPDYYRSGVARRKRCRRHLPQCVLLRTERDLRPRVYRT